MHLIQPLLLFAFLAALFAYLRFGRSQLWDRIAVLSLFVAGCVAVVVPSSTQRVADYVGVGRGTDLTFYLFAAGFVFFGVLTYSKLTQLRRELTEIVRHIAISEALAHNTGGIVPPAHSDGDTDTQPRRR